MQPLDGPEAASGKSPVTHSTGQLDTFLAKAVAGDIVSECMLLFSKNSEAQISADRQGVRLRGRRIRAYRQKRIAYLQKKLEAAKKSGFFDSLGKILGAIGSAVTAAVSIFCPPAAAGAAALASATMSSGCMVAGAHFSRRAALRAADALEAGKIAEEAAGEKDEFLAALDTAAGVEKAMYHRLSELAQTHRPDVIIN